MKFKLDTLYSFKYRPITPKHRLLVWDAKPLIFALDISPKMILGINLHWIKKQHQQEFLDEISQIVLKSKGKYHKIRLTYTLLKRPKFRYALEGIRLYYTSRISQLTYIPERKWHQVLNYKKFDANIKEFTKKTSPSSSLISH